MKKFLDFIISTRMMAVLLIVYAVAMGYATFLENDYGTPTAKALIYEAKWFEIVMLLLILNFIGNITRYRLWKKGKLPVLIFHLSFILIFIGGAITRYISYEGMMLIREGTSSNEIVSQRQFFKMQVEENGERLNYEVPYIMSPLHKNMKAKFNFNTEMIEVKSLDYIPRKKDSLIENNQGTRYLHFVTAGKNGRENYYLQSGESKSLNGILVTFNRNIDGAIEFKEENGELYIKSPTDAEYMTMATQAKGKVKKNEFNFLELRSLYTINDINIVVPDGIKIGKLISYAGDKVKDKGLYDVLKVEVKTPDAQQKIDLLVDESNPSLYKQITVGKYNIILGYGPKIYQTPFSIKLDDFVMENYPGSDSPSAFESHVKIIDEGKETPHRIYMNNVLDYKGYRFFQSGFDPDRMGTRLSVNHDYWGTLITYIGYFFLFTAMFVVFFWKGTRFSDLIQQLKKISKKSLAVITLFLSVGLFSQNQESKTENQDEYSHNHDGHNHAEFQDIDMHGKSDGSQHQESRADNQESRPQSQLQPQKHMANISADEAIAKTKISKEHAEKFAYLLVQNIEGRIVPINTQALDVLRKLYKKDEFKGTDEKSLTANQWFLSIHTNTPLWMTVPMIKISNKGGERLLKKTKANEDGYTSLVNLFPPTANGQPQFVLQEDFDKAFATKVAKQSEYDKQVIKINEQVQIFNQFFGGQLMRVVPVKNDPNHTWTSWYNQNFEPDTEAQKIIGPYLAEVVVAQETGDWKRADAELDKLKVYQQKWAENIVPSENKVNLEVLMNKININFKLLIFYTLIGGLLLLLAFIELFKPTKISNKIIKGLIFVGSIGYFFQFLGLIGRWYISGHAPWSNGYEAIVFISWVGITSGLLLYKNANALIPAAGFMVAVIMMGFAHGGSALDPQITPLVPVLKSYWLVVHVAIITSSYGFFGLSFVIAIITLLFYTFSNKTSFEKNENTTIKELSIVSEMALTIGLYALTIGTFMGGIWANESWGRYWSWDPKETWALVAIMVYAFVLHMRLVPGLRGRWAYHVAAMISISSVIMTYFGVNYYLSGLHSYAAGDPIPVPIWVYVGIAGMFLLSLISYFRYKALNKKMI